LPFQRRDKAAANAKQAALDGAGRDAEALGDLLHRPVLAVVRLGETAIVVVGIAQGREGAFEIEPIGRLVCEVTVIWHPLLDHPGRLLAAVAIPASHPEAGDAP